jgi:serine/threonine protein kinase
VEPIMPRVTSCPAPHTLEQFALGKLPDFASATLNDHLAGCTICSDAVEGLKKSSLGGQTGQNGADPTRISTEQFPFLSRAENANELGRLGQYRILKVLGEGGMGIVFQAQDATLERLVALKVMKPQTSTSDVSRKRFNQEARAAASIQHDHIVTIYHVGEDNGIPYLAMPFLQGESLENRLRRSSRLPVAEILRIGREVAEGLAAAHARGMIHRDIKPANIWLEDLGSDIPPRVKILDFGLARVGGDQFQHLTRTGVVMGTPGYMAPEQARGLEGIDHRCDLFSLGCVLYHMATGREPFRGEDVMATLMALALEEPPPIRQFNPEAPQALADLVSKLMAKNPDERPTSIGGVCKALATMEQSLHQPAPIKLPQKTGLSGERKSRLDSSLARPEAPRPSRQSQQPKSSPDAAAQIPTTPLVKPPLSGNGHQSPEAGTTNEGGPADNALSPNLENTGIDSVGTESDPTLGPCPRCGALRNSPAAKGWCLSCGYFPEEEKAPVPVEEKTKGVPKWCWYLLAGAVVVIVVSILGDLMLPKHCYARAWWGTLQLGLGIVIVVIADILAFLFVLPTGSSVSFVDMLLPIQLWISTFEELPKTRRPVCLLGWGLTTMLCAVLLVGGQLYWFKKHPIHNSATASTSKKDEEQEKDELDAEVEPFDSPEGAMEKKEELEGVDTDDETDTDKDSSRPLRSRYVVVGYIPGASSWPPKAKTSFKACNRSSSPPARSPRRKHPGSFPGSRSLPTLRPRPATSKPSGWSPNNPAGLLTTRSTKTARYKIQPSRNGTSRRSRPRPSQTMNDESAALLCTVHRSNHLRHLFHARLLRRRPLVHRTKKCCGPWNANRFITRTKGRSGSTP